MVLKGAKTSEIFSPPRRLFPNPKKNVGLNYVKFKYYKYHYTQTPNNHVWRLRIAVHIKIFANRRELRGKYKTKERVEVFFPEKVLSERKREFSRKKWGKLK